MNDDSLMEGIASASGPYLKEYRHKMVKILSRMHPEWDVEDIEKVVKKEIKERCVNPEVTLDNNYTGERRDSRLLGVLDWIIERKPIIAGNGTFYKNQHEAINPVANMLKGFLDQRAAYKREMFAVSDTRSRKYQELDLSQQNEKILANSYYGGSGMPSSAFYSEWSGAATTLSAQSVISTAEQMFEGLIADNYTYLDITEVFEFFEDILREFDFMEFDDFIQSKSPEDVAYRYTDKIIDDADDNFMILLSYLENCTDDELSVLYYTNNLSEFIRDHKPIQELIIAVFAGVENLEYAEANDANWVESVPAKYIDEFINKTPKEWNKFVDREYFMNPNDPPKSIISELSILSSYVAKYVYARYLSFDRIYRLRNFTRYTVTVIDTDSNILSLDTIIAQIFDEVIKDKGFGRTYERNTFIAVNMIAYILTNTVRDILLYYGENSNIPEEYRPIFNMKNEFYFSRLLIGEKKKRYISKIILREGNLMNPPKSDIKGFDFKKSTTSEYAEKVFMNLINKHILQAEEINLKPILRDVNAFKDDIKTSITNGETKYLPNASAKAYEAYKNPNSQQALKGVVAWNLLNPDNPISLPSKVSMLKLTTFKESDLSGLDKTHPKIYDTIIDKIFHDTTGMFVQSKYESDIIRPVNPRNKKWYDDIPKKYRTKYKKLGPSAWNEFAEVYEQPEGMPDGHYEYTIKGLQYIAIPQGESIPEWIMPYIDYATVINNIVAPFVPVLETLGMKTIEEGKTINGTNRKTKAVTNIVKF